MTAEAHVMAHRSAREVDAWADFCDLVIVHVESDDWKDAVARIERRGVRAGLAVSRRRPRRPCRSTCPCCACRSCRGRPGARSTSGCWRSSALRDAAPGRPLGVDGGVRREHAEALSAAGADWAVVGTDLVFDGTAAWSDLLRPAADV